MKKLWTYLFAFLVEAEAAFRSQGFEQLLQYKDRYVSTGTLWSQNSDSIYSCAIFCQNDNQCLSFFYGENVCSGYDQTVPNTPDMTVETGVEFYRRQVTCEGGYIFNEETNVCYKVYTVAKKWSEAMQVCQDDGANLAVIDTAEKLTIYKNLPDPLCSGVFVPIFNKCYWLTSSANTWYIGDTTCNSDGGTPASFPDISSYVLVVNEAGINGSNAEVWIGVNDLPSETVYKNYDETALAFTDYLFDYGTEGSWNGRDALAIIPAESCIWRERAETTDMLKMLCEINLNDEYWIGGSDSITEGTWKWGNGQEVNISYFLPGQLDGGSAENCAVLQFTLSGLSFKDDNCLLSKKFICEKT